MIIVGQVYGYMISQEDKNKKLQKGKTIISGYNTEQ